MKKGRSVVLAIAGERCGVACPNNPEAVDTLARDLSALVTDDEPDVTFSVDFVGEIEKPTDPDWKINRMLRRQDGYVGHGQFRWVRVSTGLDHVDARVSEYLQLGIVLRVALSTILPLKGRGFMVHAAVAGDEDGVYLFPGESGAGKSTLISQSRNKRCLAEEIAVVRREKRGYGVYGFPHWGTLETYPLSPQPAKLRGMFLLKKGLPEVNPVTRPEALAYLLRSVYFPLWDLESRHLALGLCSQFMQEVPAAELVFEKTPEFWRCIDRG